MKFRENENYEGKYIDDALDKQKEMRKIISGFYPDQMHDFWVKFEGILPT